VCVRLLRREVDTLIGLVIPCAPLYAGHHRMSVMIPGLALRGAAMCFCTWVACIWPGQVPPMRLLVSWPSVKTVTISGMYRLGCYVVLDVLLRTERTSLALFSPPLAISRFASTVRNTTFSIYHTAPPTKQRARRRSGNSGSGGKGKRREGWRSRSWVPGARNSRCSSPHSFTASTEEEQGLGTAFSLVRSLSSWDRPRRTAKGS
jgi:hypothetical protein